MLAHETVLRQRYSLSFLTTTLLIALTTQSSLAFSINPLGPVGATQNWDPDESYTLTNQRTGITRLNPTAVLSLTQGGTSSLFALLNSNFSDWTFNSAANDLAGTFEVQTYDAVGTASQVGAQLRLQYIPGINDPTPNGNNLHWIQRVVNNHNIRAGGGHDINANIIDNDARITDPFYDITFGVQPFDERTFFDFSRRVDTDKNHNWLAELYLVDETAPKQVTIYNGIQWGWNNEVVPEPLTIFGSGIGLGLGVFFKKYSMKQEKAKKLEKQKS
ncbi:PEP-CTERM sorting domain-containing protein [Microcoleus sp. C2C3]|uniref:PEP-CTERM sorting domain-containing protein n=1 Tax=unclassified Microcoleus TaxID=2642155 RepID=UPI002FD705F9